MSSEHYTKDYYAAIRDGSLRSAEIIAPLILNLLPVKSIVDVGCGVGAWLAVFRKLGVDDIFGLDGEYILDASLEIPRDRFQAVDLSKPFSLGRTFDLAISLEVAEHLPADSAVAFVESLVRLAHVVLFSAAIPFQGGNHHINEQWPDNWAELFAKHGYVPIDFIRKQVWQNEAVEFWYAQNILLFARSDLVETSAALKSEFQRTNPNQLRLVHPRQFLYLHDLYRDAVNPPPAKLKEASRIFLVSLKNSIRWRLGRIGKKETPVAEQPSPADQPPGART
jgi:SAM-dependent methyltransferase